MKQKISVTIQEPNGCAYNGKRYLALVERRSRDGALVVRGQANNGRASERLVCITQMANSEKLTPNGEKTFADYDLDHLLRYSSSLDKEVAYGYGPRTGRTNFRWMPYVPKNIIIQEFLKVAEEHISDNYKQCSWVPEWANGIYVDFPVVSRAESSLDSLRYAFVRYERKTGGKKK